jgi:hypothetical protein
MGAMDMFGGNESSSDDDDDSDDSDEWSINFVVH